ncbi:putative metalloprotease CJM1_0395 family protein [Succinivibrio dextrinosolvens]|uniref:putative metalloprotease CJM1_0395 family protein n=1 Tax=Succinivibrio dextrinosolvens TaxID=83771 RepID=UPI00241D5031|nr:putative metalloprotease CJM1_0395 family protein [Succinivibrio dextrinosolvens]MBE6422987.1 hypothetical protein [Succinivibrio dextrinosolvens]
MSLVNTIYLHSIEGSENRVYQAHNTAVSLVGNREEDEKKKNTLQDDVVTLSEKPLDASNDDLFSKNRSKALMAYRQFSNISIEDAAKSVSQSQELPNEKTEDIENEETQSDEAIKTDPDNKDDKEKDKKKIDKENDKKSNGEELSDKEQAELEELKKRDQEVKTHEKAHQSAGGQYASAPVYEYKKGPDGKDYAVGGHVNIDTSEESDPDKTIEKMRIVIKAAKAPAQPSGQDMKVAAEAQQTLNEAQMEKAKKQQEEMKSKESSKDGEESTDTKVEAEDIKTESQPDSKPKASLSET